MMEEEIKDYETASRILVSVGKKPKTEQQKIKHFQANYFLANHYISKEQWSNAQQYANNSLKSAKKVKGDLRNVFIGRAHAIIAELHNRLQEYSLVKNNYEKSIKFFEKTDISDLDLQIEYFSIFEKYITALNRVNGIKVVLKILQKYWDQNFRNNHGSLVAMIFLSPLLFHYLAHVNEDGDFFNYFSLAVITPFLKITKDKNKHDKLWEKKIEQAILDGNIQLERLFELEKNDIPTLGKEFLEVLAEMADKKLEDVDHFHLSNIMKAREKILEDPQFLIDTCKKVESDPAVSPYVCVVAYNEAIPACLQFNKFNRALEFSKLAQSTLNKIKNRPNRLNTFLNGLISLNLGRIYLKKQSKAAEKTLKKAVTNFEKTYLAHGHAAMALFELTYFAIQQKNYANALKHLERILSYQDELKNPRILGRAHGLLAQTHYLMGNLFEAAINAGKAAIIFNWMADGSNLKSSLNNAVNILYEYLENKKIRI
ncbi:MAG: hypothetical protein ACTSRW_15450 [Candidatus Helarchaeota archaeon]